jgi:hypothetical protein
MSNTVNVTVNKLSNSDYIILVRDSYLATFVEVAKDEFQDNAEWIMEQVKATPEFDDIDETRYAYRINTPTKYFQGGHDPEAV